jgi:hypothetical protein
MVCQWFDLKTTMTVSWFGPQNQGRRFGDLGPQNHRDGFLVCASKPSGRRCASLCLKTDERMKTVQGKASTSGGLLRREASIAKVSQFASKLSKERQWVVHVASSQRSRGSEAKDDQFDGVGCGAVEAGSNYPSLDVNFLLAHSGILVFYFRYK